MEMFLMALCMSVFALGVAVAAFRAATISDSSKPAAQLQLPLVKAVAPPRFFSDSVAIPPAVPSGPIPIEVLLLQIENHVRMEQAAAESFISFPTHAQLHRKTTSPFVN